MIAWLDSSLDLGHSGDRVAVSHKRPQKELATKKHKMHKMFSCALCAFLWLSSVLNAEGAHAAIEVAAVDAH